MPNKSQGEDVDAPTSRLSRHPSILTLGAGEEEACGLIGAACLLLFVGHFGGAAAPASNDALEFAFVDGLVLFVQHPLEAFLSCSGFAFDASEECALGERRIGAVDDVVAKRRILL